MASTENNNKIRDFKNKGKEEMDLSLPEGDCDQ